MIVMESERATAAFSQTGDWNTPVTSPATGKPAWLRTRFFRAESEAHLCSTSLGIGHEDGSSPGQMISKSSSSKLVRTSAGDAAFRRLAAFGLRIGLGGLILRSAARRAIRLAPASDRAGIVTRRSLALLRRTIRPKPDMSLGSSDNCRRRRGRFVSCSASAMVFAGLPS